MATNRIETLDPALIRPGELWQTFLVIDILFRILHMHLVCSFVVTGIFHFTYL